MFGTFKRQKPHTSVDDIACVLVDEPVDCIFDLRRRCQAIEELLTVGADGFDAMPALLRTLVVKVSIDCHLILRVVAAEAVWKIGERHDLALPFLTWALKDDYWGISRKAAEVLGEMGPIAHQAIPDLVWIVDQRLNCGPFLFETIDDVVQAESKPRPFLAVLATALGQCGLGYAHPQEAREALLRLTSFEDEVVRTAARQSLDLLEE